MADGNPPDDTLYPTKWPPQLLEPKPSWQSSRSPVPPRHRGQQNDAAPPNSVARLASTPTQPDEQSLPWSRRPQPGIYRWLTHLKASLRLCRPESRSPRPQPRLGLVYESSSLIPASEWL